MGLALSAAFEEAPAGLRIRTNPGQKLLHSVPGQFAFPEGDPRLRAARRSEIDPADRFVPLLTVADAGGHNRGEAAFYVELGAGPGKGGKVLYIWSTLLTSPEGNAILGDAMSWMAERAAR